MRVLEVVNGLGVGGAEIALAQRIIFRPPDVEVVVLNANPGITGIDMGSVVDVHALPPRANVASFAQHLCRDLDLDVICAHAPRTLLQLLGPRPRRTPHEVPVVYEAVGAVLSEARWRSVGLAPPVSVALQRTDLLIAVSQYVAGRFPYALAPRTEVCLTGAWVPQHVTPMWPRVPGRRFIFLGRMTGIKRPLVLARIAADLAGAFRETGSEMAFVGTGPLLPKLRDLVARSGITDIVKVYGHLTDQYGALSASDTLVISSRSEGIPLTLYESKQLGLSVLTTPLPGVVELLGAEDLCVDSKSMVHLRRGVVEMLATGTLDGQEKDQIRSSAARFSMEVRAREYFALLQSTLG